MKFHIHLVNSVNFLVEFERTVEPTVRFTVTRYDNYFSLFNIERTPWRTPIPTVNVFLR
jgi:hypothetical protein